MIDEEKKQFGGYMRILFALMIALQLGLPFAQHVNTTPSDTTHLEQLTALDVPATLVSSSGDRLYAAGGGQLRVFDTSTPAAPQALGTLPLAVQDMRVADGRVYAASDAALKVVGISAAGVPQIQRTIPLTTTALISPMNDRAATAVEVVGHYAYVVWYERRDLLLIPSAELAVLDLTRPDADAVVGRLPLGSLWSGSIQVRDGLAYVAGATDIGGTRRFYSPSLSIVDVHAPNHPALVGSSMPDCPALEGCVDSGPDALSVVGDLAYYGASARGALNVVDVSQPATPVLQRALPIAPADIEQLDRWMLVASYSAGVNVLDRSDPISTTVVTTLDTPGTAVDLAVKGDIVYVADTDSLRVLRLVPQAAAAVGADAQEIAAPFGNLRVSVPAGAFAQAETLTTTLDLGAAPLRTGGLYGVGEPFTLAGSAAPTQPLTLTLGYDSAGLGPVDASKLAMYRWADGAWQRDPSSVVDAAAKTVSVRTSSFGRWLLAGQAQQIYLPLVLR